MANWIQDAGHGGVDPGAVSHGNTEKVYTLEAALYVDKRLADHGIASDLTRSSDVTIGPNQRTSIVKNYKKCISHHFNAGGGSGAEAIHSIFANGKFENMLIEEFKKAGYPVRPRSVFFRKSSSGGDYYYMQRETGKCRTTIIEYEFVDGPQSEKIKDKSYREGMYECVVRAICRDEGVVYNPPVSAKVENNSKQKEVGKLSLRDVKPTATPNKGIGVVRVLEDTVLRESPVYTSPIIRKLNKDEEYVVFGLKNGWYNGGNSWIHSGSVFFLPNINLEI